MKTKKRKTIEINLGVLIVAIALTVIGITMLKYHVEGEKEMPYVLKQMVLISTANGENKQNDNYKWDIDIYQNTDIYFDIVRNTDYKSNESIKSITIQDIQVEQKGKYKPFVYIPTKNEEKIFTYIPENIAGPNIEYTVDKNKDVQNRKITSEGGIIALSFCIPNIGTYTGNDDTMSYDGTLLNKIGINKQDISYNAKFSLIIETESNKKYKAEISLELPNEDITQSGVNKIEDSELSNIIFKRI